MFLKHPTNHFCKLTLCCTSLLCSECNIENRVTCVEFLSDLVQSAIGCTGADTGGGLWGL